MNPIDRAAHFFGSNSPDAARRLCLRAGMDEETIQAGIRLADEQRLDRLVEYRVSGKEI